MPVRNVQKSGNMFYVYLPTAWCRKHGVGASSKIAAEESADGSLIISSGAAERPSRSISINLEKCSIGALEKLVMACYVNPAKSFRIRIRNPPKLEGLLSKKGLFGIELIEIGKNSVSCESTITIESPLATLRTMVQRIRTMVLVMTGGFDRNIIEKHEEEIDRKKVLIEKAIISSLSDSQQQKIRAIDLHYISRVSKNLESAADHIILLEKSDRKYLGQLLPVIDCLKGMFEETGSEKTGLNVERAAQFIDLVDGLPEIHATGMKGHGKARIKSHLLGVAEDLVDWAVTKTLQKD
ncbi:MAG: hypothetical protein HY394_03230 [Candidatus Diapherotrites archaeon]|nr:hypothetical protein [Candidatus Diapherotrites archaeon]